jgi:hypothetical protein
MPRRKGKPATSGSEPSPLSDTDRVGAGTPAGEMPEEQVPKQTSAGKTPSRNDNSTDRYFRQILTENPVWVTLRSNEPIFKQWLEDHPGYTAVPQEVKNGLSNVKSTMFQRQRRRKRSDTP